MTFPNMRANALKPGLLLLCAFVLTGLGGRSAPSGTIVSAQRFQLRDSTGRPLAEISLAFEDGRRSFDLSLYKGDPNERFNTQTTLMSLNTQLLSLLEPESAGILTINVWKVLAFMRMRTSLSSNAIFTRGKGAMTSPPGRLEMAALLAKSMANDAVHYVSPPKPHPALDELMPTEDIRLLDKDGQLFLTTGLSHNAEPSLAIFEQRGALSAVITMNRFGGFDVSMFDADGERRVVAGLGLDSTSVVLTEDFPVVAFGLPQPPQYVLDPNTLAEIPWNQAIGKLPWLGHRASKVTLPVTLFDQRNNVVWRAP